jgi:hypothetical protein
VPKLSQYEIQAVQNMPRKWLEDKWLLKAAKALQDHEETLCKFLRGAQALKKREEKLCKIKKMLNGIYEKRKNTVYSKQKHSERQRQLRKLKKTLQNTYKTNNVRIQPLYKQREYAGTLHQERRFCVDTPEYTVIVQSRHKGGPFLELIDCDGDFFHHSRGGCQWCATGKDAWIFEEKKKWSKVFNESK